MIWFMLLLLVNVRGDFAMRAKPFPSEAACKAAVEHERADALQRFPGYKLVESTSPCVSEPLPATSPAP